MDFSYLFGHSDPLVRTLAYVNAGLVTAVIASWGIFGVTLRTLWTHHVRTVEKFTDIMQAAKEFMARVSVGG